MKLINPFKSHLAQFEDGKYCIRRWCTLGWEWEYLTWHLSLKEYHYWPTFIISTYTLRDEGCRHYRWDTSEDAISHLKAWQPTRVQKSHAV